MNRQSAVYEKEVSYRMMNKRPRRILKKVRLGALYLPFYRWTFPLPLPFIRASTSEALQRL